MNYFIDQSGKMESAGPTVLAIANDETRTFLIDPIQKQYALERLGRKYYKQSTSMAAIRLFARAVAILVAFVPERDLVIIDTEYTGHNERIRQIIGYQLTRQRIVRPDDHILFQQIGRKSGAHVAAIAVLRGKREADHKLKATDLLD